MSPEVKARIAEALLVGVGVGSGWQQQGEVSGHTAESRVERPTAGFTLDPNTPKNGSGTSQLYMTDIGRKHPRTRGSNLPEGPA